MATNRPRKPRKFRAVAPTPTRSSTLSGAKKWDAIAKRLEREYDTAKRNAERQANRRARRTPEPDDLFAPQFEEVASHPLEQRALFPWMENEGGLVSPRPGTAPQDEDYDPYATEQDVNVGSVYELYAPTRTINPGRPRTLQMRYDRQTRILRVTYRDGGTYDYFQVPGSIWYRIRQVRSPGRFIDRNIKGVYDYERVAL